MTIFSGEGDAGYLENNIQESVYMEEEPLLGMKHLFIDLMHTNIMMMGLKKE